MSELLNTASKNTQRENIVHRITDYLASGGLFNPELMRHAAVRDLLIDCRAEVEALRDALRTVRPALREVLWCALCWNDHNFRESDLFDHAKKAAESLGLFRMDGVDKANELFDRIDAALEESK